MRRCFRLLLCNKNRGTSFLEEIDELFHKMFPDVCSAIDREPAPTQEQVSMAVSVADLEGRSPDMKLGQGPATPGSSSLFLRRQASKKGTGINLADPDSMAVPGSLAVSAAQVDGGSPSLKLRSDGESTLLGRRSARGTPVSTPTSTAMMPGSPMSPVPTQEILSWAVSVDEAEGKETIISDNPKAALLSRRSSMKASPAPANEDGEAGDEGAGTIMTATASDMDGQMISPSLALGADSNFKASIFNRRKSQKAECTLASTTTLSALGDQPTQVSFEANIAEKSGLLQRRQSQRAGATGGGSSADGGDPNGTQDIMEPQTIASFAVSAICPCQFQALSASMWRRRSISLAQHCLQRYFLPDRCEMQVSGSALDDKDTDLVWPCSCTCYHARAITHIPCVCCRPCRTDLADHCLSTAEIRKQRQQW